MCLFKLSCQSHLKNCLILFPSFLHLLTVAFNIYLLGLNALKLCSPKNGSDAPQCCSAANNFRSLYNVRAYRANINFEVAYIVLYYVHQWWLCGTNVLSRKKNSFQL